MKTTLRQNMAGKSPNSMVSSGKITDFRGILTQLVEIIPSGNLTVCCGSPGPWNHRLMICCSCYKLRYQNSTLYLDLRACRAYKTTNSGFSTMELSTKLEIQFVSHDRVAKLHPRHRRWHML